MNDWIDKYLDGEMTVREQVTFEELLRKDTALRQEYLLRKAIDQAMAEQDIMNLRDQLNEIMNVHSKKRLLRPVMLSVSAAILIILVVIGVKFLIPQQAEDGEQLFAHYYQRYPSFLNARSAADVSDQEQLTREAFGSFNHKEFKTAKKHFMELLQSDKNNHLAKFYLAVSCIELNDFSHAERYLEELTHTPNHIFWEQSHWYLSLVYLKQEKYDEAEQILRTIVNEQFINFSDAEEILKQMD